MKSKSLIILAIAVALLVGISYLSFQISGAQQPSTSAKAPSTPQPVAKAPGTSPGKPVPSAVATNPSTRPEKPEPKLPSPVLTSNGTPPQEPVHQLPTPAVSKLNLEKEPVHHEGYVPLHQGPAKATGDDCTNPIIVTLPAQLPYSDINQTNCGRLNDYSTTCLGSYDDGEDIIYRLDVTAAVVLDITMNPKGSTWTGMAVDDACPLDPTTCLYKSTGSSGSRILTGVSLAAGTYWIMIDTWPDPTCIPNFDLTITGAAPPPPNDNCGSATPIGDVTDLPFSTTTATHDQGTTCTDGPNIWYVYTATCSGLADVNLCGSLFDTKLGVYDGYSCSPLPTLIRCNDDSCSVQSEMHFIAVAGHQYLIEVGGYSTYTGNGDLTVSCQSADQGACCNNDSPYDCALLNEADCIALGNHTWKGAGTTCTPNPCYPPPANDNCENAIVLNPPVCPDVQTVNGTTLGATIDCPGVLDKKLVWYKFDLTYTCNNVYVDYCPTSNPLADWRMLVLYNSCPVDCPNYLLYTGYAWVTCPGGATDLQINWKKLPAGTYWLPVLADDASLNQMDFAFSICVEECPPAQPGDNCDVPIEVTLNKGAGDVLYQDLGQTTCGRGDDYNATCLGYYDGGEDIIYEVTVSTAVRVNITLDPKGTTYTGIAVDDACPLDATTCLATSTNSGGTAHGISGLDLAPGTYYIMVDTWPSPACIPDFDLVITEVGVGPANDECTGAPVINTFPTTVSGTTIGASIDCPGLLDWNSVWYQFDLPYTCNNVTVDFCPTGAEIYQVGIVLYNSCPPVCANYILNSGINWPTCGSGFVDPQITWNNLPAGSYWFPVAVWDPSMNQFMDFSFTVDVAECGPSAPGENCATAISVPSLPYETTGNSCGFLNDYDAVCNYTGSTAPDVVYSYSPATNQAINISLCNSLYDTKVYVYEDACASGTHIACNDDACGSDTYKSAIYGLGLTAGHTYFIVVDGYGASCGDYDLIITEAGAAPPNDNCDGAISVSVPLCPDVVTVNGTTIGATLDCPGVLDWNAVWYEFELPYASNKLTIDYCPTVTEIYTVGIVIYNSCPVSCSDYILASGYQFVGCPNGNTGPQMWWSGLPAGTYWLPVSVIDAGGSPFMDFTFTACVEPLVAPPNDNCANATPVGDVTDLPFSTEAATFDGPGLCQTAPNIWYCYTATCDGNAYVSVCGSAYDTKIAAYDGCTCPPTTLLACNDDACGGYLQSEIAFPVVMGQTYLIELGGYSTSTGSGVLSITCALPPPNDECTGAPVISSFPTTVSGTTIGASVDCPGVLDWNAVWYQFDLPYNCNEVTVDFCPTNSEISNVGVVLYNSCPADCPNYILYSAVTWPTCNSGYVDPVIVWTDLAAGSYWFPVYLGSAMDFSFTVSVDSCMPCDVVCPSGGVPEGEPTCYDEYDDVYNGGCNSTPIIFQNITCGETICGTSGVYAFSGYTYRDMDWFTFDVSDGDLTFKAVAEFPVAIWLLDPGSGDCSDVTQIAFMTAAKCDTAIISQTVAAGTYWLIVAPSDWGAYPCGVEYVATLECVGMGPQISVSPTSFDQLLNPTGACSSATKNLVISSVGGEDLNWSIAENPPAAWLSVSPTSGTLPPGQKDTLDVSFNAGGMSPGDYNTNLKITSNAPKGEVIVPVHLKVELAPEINVATRLWVPVIPGCTMDKTLRVDNLGTGELRFEVSVKKNPPKQADVLLVDDDNSYNYPVDFTDVVSYFTAALDANGYTYTIFEVTSIGGDGPDAATMADYPVVIWFTGESWQLNQTLTPNDEANLATYLDGGGNLFLSGQDYFYDRYPSAGSFSTGQFPYDYLGVTYVSQDLWGIYYPSTGSCDGMPGSVAEGMSFTLSDPYTAKGLHSKGPDDGLYIDEITHNGVDLFNMTNPSPEGIAACQYEGAGFKTVFTTVDFAGLLDTKSTMAEFMGSIMNWFMGAACPFTVSPEEGTIPAESFFDVFLTFDGNVFENCVEETLACYLVFTSNDCDESQVTVPVYMWSARGDVNGDCRLDVVDVVFLLNWIFIDGPAPDPLCVGDVNRSGGDPDSDDILYLISYLFMYGPPPQIPLAPSR